MKITYHLKKWGTSLAFKFFTNTEDNEVFVCCAFYEENTNNAYVIEYSYNGCNNYKPTVLHEMGRLTIDIFFEKLREIGYKDLSEDRYYIKDDVEYFGGSSHTILVPHIHIHYSFTESTVDTIEKYCKGARRCGEIEVRPELILKELKHVKDYTLVKGARVYGPTHDVMYIKDDICNIYKDKFTNYELVRRFKPTFLQKISLALRSFSTRADMVFIVNEDKNELHWTEHDSADAILLKIRDFCKTCLDKDVNVPVIGIEHLLKRMDRYTETSSRLNKVLIKT